MHVHNFSSYFYVKVQSPDHLGPSDVQAIQDLLNKLAGGSESSAPPVKAVEVIRDKASVMNYQSDKATFLKIYTGLPRYVNQLRTLFENGSVSYPKGAGSPFEQVTYESNLPYALRFMIDNEIVGMSWIRVRAGRYRLRERADKLCNTQYEIDVEDFNDVECLPCDGVYSKIAPLRTLSFDIECSADKGRFPQAQTDPII
jgi:DNA polymerase delta subunit 1